MTDTEQKRIKAICKVAHVDDISDLSDGYHTFKQLYYQRMILFATLVKQNRGKAWKSLRHEDGELCFGGGWFIVGIDTPKGSYTYHYEDNFYSLFDCIELERSKHWDGHTEVDVTRLLSLEQEPCKTLSRIEYGSDGNLYELSISGGTNKALEQEPCEDCISRQAVLDLVNSDWKYEGLETAIGDLPPVTPQPKTGHWIPRNSFLLQYECSECGCQSEKYKYCPNCGRRMFEPQESEG